MEVTPPLCKHECKVHTLALGFLGKSYLTLLCIADRKTYHPLCRALCISRRCRWGTHSTLRICIHPHALPKVLNAWHLTAHRPIFAFSPVCAALPLLLGKCGIASSALVLCAGHKIPAAAAIAGLDCN